LGNAAFTVPEKSYKLRVDYNSKQYWTEVINVIAYQDNPVELALDLLALNLTNNPNPQRIDGKGPEYRPQVAMLGDLTGLFAQLIPQVTTGREARTFYYISDHLNTAQLMVDALGTIVWQGEFKPFGGVDIVVNDLKNQFRFSGQYYDDESGLHYNWHRFYDPATGRYISADPIGLDGGINLYGYVGGNPVNWIDPTGEGYGSIIIGTAALGTIMSTGYLGVNAKWGTEINRLIWEATMLLNEELKKKCPDWDYIEALKIYIDELEQIGLLNAWQALQYGLGMTEPISNLPILPLPSTKPVLPEKPSK
jgi:RHS repeat-associated protein